MRARMLVLAAVVALASASAPAHAVPEGQYKWITPLVGFGQFSDKLSYPGLSDSLDDAPLFGARLGMQFNRYWGLEAGGAFSSTQSLGTDTDVTYLHLNGSLMFTPTDAWPMGAPYLALGGGWAQRSADGVDELHYGTFEQAVGWRGWFSNSLGLRLEARNVLSVPHENFGAANKADQQYWAGLDFAWGGTPKDTDGDGVPDRKDKCPDTPKGARVDLTGCPTDADFDGVWDGLDTCAETPKGAKVNAQGCPTDADGDGVWDGLDTCADTPKGATVNAQGCPSDSDGDKVWDGLDQCPNTPTGATVDAKGCPVDSDGDGVADGLDKCPNTSAGLKVDSDGCPIVVTERETELLDTGMIRLQNINFETGKADLLPESFQPLDEVGAILRKWPELQVEVGGHTDSRGSRVRNQTLSEARANAVRDYLVQKYPDIQAAQLSAKGYGPSKPIAPNNNALNMAKNRRVEFVVLNKDVLKREVEKRNLLKK
jgi:OOP family OmpA-OmpF porin